MKKTKHESPASSKQQAKSGMPDQPAHGSVFSYVVGFVLSIILTLIAYSLVVNQVFSGWELAFAITGLALVQLTVQLLFFLHLGRGTDARLNVLAFGFMLIVVIIVAAGSLWIMSNLHYNTTPPRDLDQQLIREEGIRK